MRKLSEDARARGLRIGFVPTMGYLHEGHLSLLDRAVRENDLSVMSIFVNPLQFGPTEDFERYPRDVNRDRRLARERGCDVLFCPRARDLYPEGFSTTVRVKVLEDKLCGRFRPGHFEGVCTVVMKLLNIVRPHVLYLGQKDAQQAVVLKRMIADLNVDVSVKVCPIVREKDGLAMSSRNEYLSAEEREEAPALYRALRAGAQAVRAGGRDPAVIRDLMRRELGSSPLARAEYLEVVDPATLETPRRIAGRVLLAGAAWFGKTRLIDNIVAAPRKPTGRRGRRGG